MNGQMGLEIETLMSRKTVEHTPTSLFALAEDLKEAGAQVEAVAKELKSAKVWPISVNHQAPIDHGLKTVPVFVNECKSKILKKQQLAK